MQLARRFGARVEVRDDKGTGEVALHYELAATSSTGILGMLGVGRLIPSRGAIVVTLRRGGATDGT